MYNLLYVFIEIILRPVLKLLYRLIVYSLIEMSKNSSESATDSDNDSVFGLNRTLTINPNDEHQMLEYKENRIHVFSEYISSVLYKHIKPYADYTAYLEISRPAKSDTSKIARLHIHGTLYFKSESSFVLFYANEYHKLIKNSMVCIDTIENASVWNDYITKDHELMKSIGKCVYTDCDLKPRLFSNWFKELEKKDGGIKELLKSQTTA